MTARIECENLRLYEGEVQLNTTTTSIICIYIYVYDDRTFTTFDTRNKLSFKTLQFITHIKFINRVISVSQKIKIVRKTKYNNNKEKRLTTSFIIIYSHITHKNIVLFFFLSIFPPFLPVCNLFIFFFLIFHSYVIN